MKCKNCGCTAFVEIGDHYECTSCGFEIPIDETKELKQSAEQYNKLESLTNVLVNCLSEPRFNETLAKDTALSVIKIDSTNILACFVINYLERSTHPENYKTFIKRLETYEFIDNQEGLIVPFMINNSEYKYFDSIKNLLLAKNIYAKYNTMLYEAEKRLENQEDDYSNRARDIFVCYSSNDIDTVKSLIEKIESDGTTCWYSDRNMPKNSLSQFDYKSKIEEAISKSKVFLVIMSRNSMLSDDVKWELDMADKHQIINRIEYRIEEVENTTKFKFFFDGIQWIDAANEPQEALLLGRIYDLLHSRDGENSAVGDEDLKNDNTDNDEFTSEEDVNDEENNNGEDEANQSSENITDTIEDVQEESEDQIINDEEDSVSLNEKVIPLFKDGKFEEAYEIINQYDGLPQDTENLVYYYIGYCFEKGLGTEINLEASNHYYNLAKTNAPIGSDENLGLCFFLLGKREFTERYECQVKNKTDSDNVSSSNDGYNMLIKASEYRNTDSMVYLGLCYKYGIYVKQSDDKAFNWFADAADNNNGLGAHHLGRCYEQGKGVTQNNEEAFKAYLKAATLQNDKGMVDLGVCYYYGIGVEKSYESAAEYYKKGAELGNLTAEYNLARCYLNGRGVQQENETGLDLMRKAAKSGYKPAIEFLSK